MYIHMFATNRKSTTLGLLEEGKKALLLWEVVTIFKTSQLCQQAHILRKKTPDENPNTCLDVTLNVILLTGWLSPGPDWTDKG